MKNQTISTDKLASSVADLRETIDEKFRQIDNDQSTISGRLKLCELIDQIIEGNLIGAGLFKKEGKLDETEQTK